MIDGVLSQNGESALMAASGYGHTPDVEVLLEYEADVNLQENVSWLLSCDMMDRKWVWLEAVT